jgi:VRR-NUC domain
MKDLLLWKGTDFFLAEIKGSGDKVSENQKRWIRDNAERLRLLFKVVKLHKASVAD